LLSHGTPTPQRRQTHWEAFIEKQLSFPAFCNRIRALAIKQQGEDTQIVIAYGAFGTSSDMGIKGLPPCMGKGLLTKLSREEVPQPRLQLRSSDGSPAQALDAWHVATLQARQEKGGDGQAGRGSG
jgi:hypothetical protein